MKRYFFRAIKYFLAMAVLCIALTVAMILTHTMAGTQGADLTFGETVKYLFASQRMTTMLVALAVLSLAYPFFGYTERRVSGSLHGEDKQVVVNAFRSAGFEITGETEEGITFRAESFGRRLTMLFEDELTAREENGWVVIRGNRRGVARVIFCWDAYAKYAENED